MEAKPGSGGAEMRILTSCHWKRGKGNQNDLGKAWAKVTLHSQDPDILLHPPRAGLGFASPF